MREFAEAHGTGVSTFRAWCTIERKQTEPSARRRISCTPDERRAAVEAFRRSGRKGEDFAKLWGCSAASLDQWIRRYDEEGPQGLEDRVRKKRNCRPHPSRRGAERLPRREG